MPVERAVPSSVIAWGWYVDGARQDCTDLAVAAQQARNGHGWVWLGLKEPTSTDLAAFGEEFGLHPLAIDDAVEGHQRSKLASFENTLFTVVSTIQWVDHAEVTATSEIVATGQIMIFLGSHFVITVRKGEHSALGNLRTQLEADSTHLAQGPWVVLHAVLDQAIDEYLAVAVEIGDDIDEVEARTFSSSGDNGIEAAYQLKREVIEFKRCIVPLTLPLGALATRTYPAVPREAQAYFRDLAEHHLQARESVQAHDDVLTSILQAGLARISVADNQDMRKISSWVAIVAVPTFIVGWYGMNFTHMPELNWMFGYPLVALIVAATMISLYVIFKRKKWL